MTLAPGAVPLAWRAIWTARMSRSIPPAAPPMMRAPTRSPPSVARREPVYGINTGFGKLAQRAHRRRRSRGPAAQPGAVACRRRRRAAAAPTVRLIMALKVASLAVAPPACAPSHRRAVALLNADVLPVIPGKGSVGASGDLAPLAHMSAALLGAGEARSAGERLPAAAGAAPRRADAARARAEGRAGAAQRHPDVDRAGARCPVRGRARVRGGAGRRVRCRPMRRKGSDTPFDARIHAAARPGARSTSPRRSAPCCLTERDPRLALTECDRVQDPYCLRCQPQVMGACLDLLRQAAGDAARSRPTASPTTRWSSPLTAMSLPAAISTPSRWPSPPTTGAGPRARSARSASGASRC